MFIRRLRWESTLAIGCYVVAVDGISAPLWWNGKDWENRLGVIHDSRIGTVGGRLGDYNHAEE